MHATLSWPRPPAMVAPLLALALAALVARPAVAQPRIIELAVESSARAIVLPSGPGSTLVLAPCDACRPLSLVATAATRYAIGGSQVPLAQLREWLAAHRSAGVVVLYARGTNTLTRVLATAP